MDAKTSDARMVDERTDDQVEDAWMGNVRTGAGANACRKARLPRAFGAVRGCSAAALGDALLEALSPTRCVGCERPGALLCDACLAELVLIDPEESCTLCGAPYGRVLCTECRGRATPLDRCLACALFCGPLPRVIRGYKDAGERRLARVIAELLLDTALHAQEVAADRYGGILADADFIAFVPATKSAYRRRGFDHMEAVARELGRMAGVPVCDCIIKHGSSDQRKLGREGRLATARSIYEVPELVQKTVRGARVLLIDDVITTGATMTAVASVLKEAGALHVDGLAAARVL